VPRTIAAAVGLPEDAQAADPTTGGIDGIVSDIWLLRQLEDLLGSLHISPTTLAVFVPYNTFTTTENPEDCLVS
jgi:hypothetical protein